MQAMVLFGFAQIPTTQRNIQQAHTYRDTRADTEAHIRRQTHADSRVQKSVFINW